MRTLSFTLRFLFMCTLTCLLGPVATAQSATSEDIESVPMPIKGEVEEPVVDIPLAIDETETDGSSLWAVQGGLGLFLT